MAKTLVAHEQPISRIFNDEYVFRIPDYQRPYAWGADQARELFEDLAGFMQENTGDISDMPPYFLGSIVLIKEETSPLADVVDGQQRLTTLTLLFSAIRTTAPSAASDITRLIYERGNAVIGTQDRFRLTLREKDREFFRDNVQRESDLSKLASSTEELRDSRQNLRANARLFIDKLKAMPEAERIRLATFVATRCFLVVVATPDLNSAYRIFSVLNSRGLELSATDILKARIVAKVPEAKRTECATKWEDAEDDLGRDVFVDLFSHIRMIYRKAKPQGTLLKEFEDHVKIAEKPLQFIDKVLLPAAEAYGELVASAYSSTRNATEVNAHLKWLNRLAFNDWLPPALAFSVQYRGDPDAMLHFFQDLERLGYFMLATKADVNDRIERFSRLTAAVQDGEATSGAGKLWLDTSALQLSKTEQYTMYAAISGAVYESLAPRSASTLLVRLDSLLSGGGAHYDYETITVEHVLPQTPPVGSQWLAWFPDPKVRLEWLNRLGNLALLTRKKNSSASNYDFKKKKDTYFKREGVSPFALTTEVLAEDTWTPEVVQMRQKKHLQVLEKHWRLEGRQNPARALLQELEASK